MFASGSRASTEASKVLAITPSVVHLKSLRRINHVMISFTKYRGSEQS